MKALSIELNCYFTTKTEMGKAADATSLAVAIEINKSAFKESGALLPTGQTWAWAQNAASLNTTYLSRHGVHAYVTGIQVDDPANTVRVQVSANLDRLFPSLVPDILVTELGLAEVRALHSIIKNAKHPIPLSVIQRIHDLTLNLFISYSTMFLRISVI